MKPEGPLYTVSVRHHGSEGRRDLSSLKNLSRAPSLSIAQKVADPKQPRLAEEPPPTGFNKLKAFLPQNIAKWLGEYVRYRVGKKHPLPPYNAAQGDNGAYRLGNVVRIGMAGDWGTGTDEAAEVAQQILAFNPEITIHLGDVYYVGDNPEVDENCLGIKNPDNDYTPTVWPKGSLGSFALNGNHEMYARGFGYFDTFLPTLGMAGKQPQKTSYFCLENDFWRLIAIDTGYHSVGIPFLEQIPVLSGVSFISGDCHLEDAILTWLRDVVRPQDPNDPRGIILLSHHQYYSSFDGSYTKPARQLVDLIPRSVLWFWGHEHRLAAYDAHQKDNGIVAIGRCVGHGGMPVERDPKVTDPDCPLKFFDNRPDPDHADINAGFNGFANLQFTNEALTVTYRDRSGVEVLHEEWVVSNGAPSLVVFRPATG